MAAPGLRRVSRSCAHLEEIEAIGAIPACRVCSPSIIPPSNEEDEVLRQKQDLFNACMTNGGQLPGEQSR
jgi:hypothetical protein